MSGYRGRTGPNFSEYLNNLNTLTSPYEDEQFNADIDLNQDLAMFTNTDFTHFDIPTLPEDGAFDFDLNNNIVPNNVKYEDLLSGADPAQTFNVPPVESATTEAPHYYNYNTPIQPAPGPGFSSTEIQPSPSTSSPSATNNAARRKTESAPPSNVSSEEKSRLAAEEDKRRRNTAASARFRVKKKQREQALERTVKEVNDKNSKLEAKITQLEMENKWLKALITEKNNGVQSKEEMAAAYQKFRKESEEREMAESQKGVELDSQSPISASD